MRKTKKSGACSDSAGTEHAPACGETAMVMRGCACRVPQGPSRRAFLTAAAGAALARGPASAQAPRRVDVHHHLAPPRWIAEVVRGRNTGQRPLADWTPQRSLDDMDRGGGATAGVSISEAR